MYNLESVRPVSLLMDNGRMISFEYIKIKKARLLVPKFLFDNYPDRSGQVHC